MALRDLGLLFWKRKDLESTLSVLRKKIKHLQRQVSVSVSGSGKQSVADFFLSQTSRRILAIENELERRDKWKARLVRVKNWFKRKEWKPPKKPR